MKAAFQGVHGAYSELACKQLLGPDCGTVPCETFEDVFIAVEKGRADKGIIPIENSLAGSIHQNYDLLLSRNLHIVGEAHLKVEHVLMCHPSTSFKDITQVRSHPQALAQCSRFFATERQVSSVVYFDTAGAAKSVADEAPGNIGAIASAYAAKLYGLKVLRTNLQNQPNNFTRFLALERKPAAAARNPAARSGAGKKSSPAAASAESKTSIVFMPENNQVGILFRILGVFALRDIDLLKIESRPNPLSPFEYWFYVDFAGGVGESKVDKALDHLREMAAELKILGSYPRAEQRPINKRKK
jgi:prephenate dehydratase